MKRAEIIKLLDRAVIGVTSPNDLEHKELETLIEDLKAGSIMLKNAHDAEALEKHLPTRREPTSAVSLAWFGPLPSEELMDKITPYTDAIVARGGQVFIIPEDSSFNEADALEQLKEVGADSHIVVIINSPPGEQVALKAQILLSKLDLGKLRHTIMHNLREPILGKVTSVLDEALRHIPGVPDLPPPAPTDLETVMLGLSQINNRLDGIERRQSAGQSIPEMAARQNQTRGWNPPGGSAWDIGRGQAGFLNPGMLRPQASDMFASPNHHSAGFRAFADQRFGLPRDPYPARGAMARKQIQIIRLYPMPAVMSKVMEFMTVAERGLTAINQDPSTTMAYVFDVFDPSHSLQESVATFGQTMIDPSWGAIPTIPAVVVTANAVQQSIRNQAQQVVGEINAQNNKYQPSVMMLDELIAKVNEVLAPVFGMNYLRQY